MVRCHLILAFLHVNDLLTTSSLCRSVHSVVDSDVVWEERLEVAEAIQRLNAPSHPPASAELSGVQLTALPPLPSLSEAAALCMHSYVESA